MQDVFEAVGAHAAGRMSDGELKLLEDVACPGAGACGGQFTANTMAIVCESLGIAAGRVVAAGSRDEVEALAGATTRRLALADDEVALPALTDAHIHLVEAARAVNQVDLSGAATLADGLAIVAAAHARLPAGAWLEGTGWDVVRWGSWPTAAGSRPRGSVRSRRSATEGTAHTSGAAISPARCR